MFFFNSDVELEVLPSAISRPMERASELTGFSIHTLQRRTKIGINITINMYINSYKIIRVLTDKRNATDFLSQCF